jgi:predicted nucleotidyltransferase
VGSETVLPALRAAVRALDGLGVQYALVGGLAMPSWGRIRATADADILLHADAVGTVAVAEALRQHGFAHMDRADRVQIDDKWILHFWFPVRLQTVSVRVDLLVGDAAEHARIVERAVIRIIDGFRARVASCEDLILLKLVAGRAIDLADARELFQVNRDSLDLVYLRGQAAGMGITEALAELQAG